MKVESIEQTRSPSGKLRVRFDNGSSLLIFPSVIAEHGIYSGMELPEAALNSLKESNAAASGRCGLFPPLRSPKKNWKNA